MWHARCPGRLGRRAPSPCVADQCPASPHDTLPLTTLLRSLACRDLGEIIKEWRQRQSAKTEVRGDKEPRPAVPRPGTAKAPEGGGEVMGVPRGA